MIISVVTVAEKCHIHKDESASSSFLCSLKRCLLLLLLLLLFGSSRCYICYLLLLQKHCNHTLDGREIFLNSQKEPEILSSKCSCVTLKTLKSSYFYTSVGSSQLLLHPQRCVKFFFCCRINHHSDMGQLNTAWYISSLFMTTKICKQLENQSAG